MPTMAHGIFIELFKVTYHGGYILLIIIIRDQPKLKSQIQTLEPNIPKSSGKWDLGSESGSHKIIDWAAVDMDVSRELRSGSHL